MHFSDLLPEIKKRPTLYLSRYSIFDFQSFYYGYGLAINQLGLPKDSKQQEFEEFLSWVRSRYNIQTTQSWASLILFHSVDERDALNRSKGIRFYGRGGFTLEQAGYASGTPDESYCIGTDKEIPDIVIEVIVSSGSINRKELYKPKRVPEVWFWKSKQLRIFHLNYTGEYEEVSRSCFFPDLDTALLLKYLDYPDQYDGVNEFTQAIRNS